MSVLAQWVESAERRYRRAAKDEFLQSADLQLIAHAKSIQATVVTREKPEPDSLKKIKIPDACLAVGVMWSGPFEVYRALGMRLGA